MVGGTEGETCAEGGEYRERPARRAARSLTEGENGKEGCTYQKRPARRAALHGRDLSGGRHGRRDQRGERHVQKETSAE